MISGGAGAGRDRSLQPPEATESRDRSRPGDWAAAAVRMAGVALNPSTLPSKPAGLQGGTKIERTVQADLLRVPVVRPRTTETTALGAAYLAGLAVGLYPSLESLAEVWQCERRFDPKMAAAERARLYAGWRDAIRRARGAPPTI